MRLENTLFISSTNAFRLTAVYEEKFGIADSGPHERSAPNDWEFLIAKEGDVSFLVDNTVYPLKKGEVLMLPPFANRLCIHNDALPFRFYRLTINRSFCETVFARLDAQRLARKCRFRFSLKDTATLYELCEDLLSSACRSAHYRLFQFFHLLLSNCEAYSEEDAVIEEYEVCLPRPLKKMLLFAANNGKGYIHLADLMKESGITTTAVNVMFKEFLHTSPQAYLEKLRMNTACELLFCGLQEAEVASRMQYKTVSHFRSVFQKHYGTTPAAYKSSKGIVHIADF